MHITPVANDITTLVVVARSNKALLVAIDFANGRVRYQVLWLLQT